MNRFKLYNELRKHKKSSALLNAIDLRIEYYADMLDKGHTIYKSRLSELIEITSKEIELKKLMKKEFIMQYIGDYSRDFSMYLSDKNNVPHNRIDTYARGKIDDYARDWVIYYIYLLSESYDAVSGKYNLDKTFKLNIHHWIGHQLQKFRFISKSPDRIYCGLTPYQYDLLNILAVNGLSELGEFNHSVSENASTLWDKNYQALAQYSKQNGHCIIENQSYIERDTTSNKLRRVNKVNADTDLEKLRLWSIRMRMLRARNDTALTEDKISKLNAIGFIWNADLTKVFCGDPQDLKESIRQIKYALDIYCAKNNINIDKKVYEKQSIQRAEMLVKREIEEQKKKKVDDFMRVSMEKLKANLIKQEKVKIELSRENELGRVQKDRDEIMKKFDNYMKNIKSRAKKLDYIGIENTLCDYFEKEGFDVKKGSSQGPDILISDGDQDYEVEIKAKKNKPKPTPC